MIKTELFYSLAVADMEDELDIGQLNEIWVNTNNIINGKNFIEYKYKGSIEATVFMPQKGFGVGHYKVKISGDHEKSVGQALHDMIETCGFPTYTKGSDSLVKKVLEPHNKKLKKLLPLIPYIREVIDA